MVIVSVGRGAAASFDPLAVAIGISFAFPYGNAQFDRIDQFSAGGEGLFAVGSGGPDPNGEIARHQVANRVDRGGTNAEFAGNLLNEASALFFRQFQISLIVQSHDLAAFVMVADPTFEKNKSPAIRQCEGLTQGLKVNGVGINEKRHGSTSRKRPQKNHLVARAKRVVGLGEFVIHSDSHLAAKT
jgi:hypothetical protein